MNFLTRKLIGYFRGNIYLARFLGVRVGENCRIYINSWGSEPYLITLGNNVTVTHGVQFITHDGSTALVLDDLNRRYYRYKNISIGDNVFIGVNSIILPGVNIGNNIIIGAGSIITKNLDSGYIYAGNPVKKICTFVEYSNKIRETCVRIDKIYENKKEKIIKASNECK